MVKIEAILNGEGVIRSYEVHVDGKALVQQNGVPSQFETQEQACKVMQQVEKMEQTRARHEALAKAKGATQFQFVVMPDGVDFGCQADFGDGLKPFYPEKGHSPR